MRKLSLEEIKKIEVNILDYISDICKKNNLKYFLAYGTLIGAIRHKGFIPWDDDIDIAMPRDDYDKLLSIIKSQRGDSKYDCLIPLEDGYYYEFAKVIDTSTIVQEQTTISSKCGVWVDIFPLDGLKKEDKWSHYLLLILNRCRAASVNKKFPHKTKGFAAPFEYIFWKICRLIGFRFFLKRSIRLSRKYKYIDCEYVGFASSYPANNKYMLRKWYERTIDVPFENKQFRAPIGYHEYLSTQYGNYMQIPPEDKRVSHHMQAFVIDKKKYFNYEL